MRLSPRNPGSTVCTHSGSFLSLSRGGSSRVEEACDIYARAANMFKMAKNWSAAGNAFCQAAQLHLQLQNKHDAATSFVDAGNAFKKADPQDGLFWGSREAHRATRVSQSAGAWFSPICLPSPAQGRFTIAAKHHITIAEIYEMELVDIEK
ncbi:PREDICTED: alpha-soluble NSF attachment protein, partial [Gekko japonicus]|uniref:Alpha-soluble NSF attachment protein n=1 Tax=Gekko japonicus TaxID=146911 RepID=A0ABM1KLC8_GEKJA